MQSAQNDDTHEYVLGIQNPTQLVSSLALMLREKNYTCLYDANVLSSPENYLKKSSLEELNRDFLYKWFLFFTGLGRNFDFHPELIIIPEVAQEMNNLLNATISAIEKRKNQYKACSPQHKNIFQNVFEQLLKNQDILGQIQQKLQEYQQYPLPIVEPIFHALLELVKLMDSTLELKKLSSRESNDTDERLAARCFYEVAVNSSNVAIYTRDDDVRKLISATFKFLISGHITEHENLSFVKNFSHLNMVVLKYNYEKKVFSRFFESSTLPNIGEFRFPRKLSKNRINQLIAAARELLHSIQPIIEETKSSQKEVVPAPAQQEKEENIPEILDNLFTNICALKIREDIANVRLKIKLLADINVLAQSFSCNGLYEKINQAKEQMQRACITDIVQQLQDEHHSLQQNFDQLSANQPHSLEYWQQIQNAAESMQENMRKLRFFENALKTERYDIGFDDYCHFRDTLRRFKNEGFTIDEKETPVPLEKISEIGKLPTAETIRIIERYKIKSQSTHAYLTQENLMLFLFLDKEPE